MFRIQWSKKLKMLLWGPLVCPADVSCLQTLLAAGFTVPVFPLLFVVCRTKRKSSLNLVKNRSRSCGCLLHRNCGLWRRLVANIRLLEFTDQTQIILLIFVGGKKKGHHFPIFPWWFLSYDINTRSYESHVALQKQATTFKNVILWITLIGRRPKNKPLHFIVFPRHRCTLGGVWLFFKKQWFQNKSQAFLCLRNDVWEKKKKKKGRNTCLTECPFVYSHDSETLSGLSRLCRETTSERGTHDCSWVPGDFLRLWTPISEGQPAADSTRSLF